MIRISGAYVGYEIRTAGREGRDFAVEVLDLRTGKIRDPDEPYAVYGEDETNDPMAGVTDMVLDPKGRVAWIIRNPFAGPGRFEVRAAGMSRKTRLLDQGTRIVPTSLSISGAIVSWGHGESKRRARLPGA